MRPDSHEIFGRRRSRNVGVGLVLGAFVLIVFAVSVVKLTDGPAVEGYDHVVRPELLPEPGRD
jgi:hypothetical protein